MKIALIGSERTIQHVLPMINQQSLFIEIFPFTCLSEDAGKIVSDCQNDVDAILFTGYFPFVYANRDTEAKKPWEYIYRNPSAFISAIFSENLRTHSEITRISSDLWNESANLLGQSLYSSVEILLNQLSIFRFQGNLLAKDVVNQIVDFHTSNYDKGIANLCLSSIERVYSILSQRGYPIVFVRPTMEIVFHQIEKLRLRHQLQIESENFISVVSIQVLFDKEHSLDGKDDDYHRFLRENIQREKIFIFARQLDGAVETHENGLSYIYTTASALKSESSSFSNMTILNRLASAQGIQSASIGIGFGRTHREAKSNSDHARLLALNNHGSCFYITYEDRKTAGPFFMQNQNEIQSSMQNNLNNISRHTALGLNTLRKLQRIIRQYNIDVTTSSELARYCGLSVTNMNRIIAKLEAGGYIRVIGNQPLAGAGRPRRLIRLNIDVS